MSPARLLAMVLVGAASVAAGCTDGNPAIDDSNLPTGSSAPPAAAGCAAVRADLEQLGETLGVPDGVDELKQMLADGLDQIETAVADAGDLSGDAARPLQSALGQAAADANRALAAVADGDYGTAREELGRVDDAVGAARDALVAACGTS